MQEITTVNLVKKILRQSIMLSDNILAVTRNIQQVQSLFATEDNPMPIPFSQSDESMLYSNDECPICFETVDETTGTYT